LRADQPDDGEVPPDQHPDRRDDQNGAGDQAARAGKPPPETRLRQEAYFDLRVAVARRDSSAARQVTAEEQAASEKWQEKVTESRSMWGEYQRKWPAAERPSADRSPGPPGSWRGEGNRELNPADNSRVEAACDRIAKLEKDRISPAMRAIESQDPDRHLVGFDRRIKDRDRTKEKVAKSMVEKGRSIEKAISLIPDMLRFTLQYDDARYTQGVWADIARMKEQGFELDILKNSWSDDQYKGINSQWIDRDSGQRFELQFHTRISFEAKQLTHPAYERLRVMIYLPDPDPLEHMVLETFQKKVTADVPVPPGVTDIPDYP
jgi:hypothetical protein